MSFHYALYLCLYSLFRVNISFSPWSLHLAKETHQSSVIDWAPNPDHSYPNTQGPPKLQVTRSVFHVIIKMHEDSNKLATMQAKLHLTYQLPFTVSPPSSSPPPSSLQTHQPPPQTHTHNTELISVQHWCLHRTICLYLIQQLHLHWHWNARAQSLWS